MPIPTADFWYGVAVASVIALLTYFFGVRRRRLTVTWDVATLIPTGGEKLAVTWDGQDVQNPFLVQVKLEANHAGDITPANYVGGGIVLDLIGGRAVGALSTDDSPPCSVTATQLLVEPFLLKHGKSATASFLASGQDAWLSAQKSKLADATVLVRSSDEVRPRRYRFLGVAYVLMGLVYAVTAGWLKNVIPQTRLEGTVLADPLFFGAIMVLLGLFALGLYWWEIHKIRSKHKDASPREVEGLTQNVEGPPQNRDATP